MERTHDDNDDERILRLRAEQLTVHTSTVRDREAVVGRDLVSSRVELVVPILVERAYVTERKLEPPFREAAPIDGPSRTIVRLSRERAFVERAVVEYERVAIGTRKAIDVGIATARLAHEELTVDVPGERA